MKIAIVGLGFVGLSFAAVLGSKNFTVLGIDVDSKKISDIKENILPFYEPKLKTFLRSAQKKSLSVSSNLELAVNDYDLIFITVGTPSLNDGSINVIKQIGEYLKKSKNKPIIIVKSTVIPETSSVILLPLLEKHSKKIHGRDFGFITNPEFLREGHAIDDTLNPHIVVLGGTKNTDIKKIQEFYSSFYKKNIPTIITNFSNAELIKYANNSFLATKISFVNQLANICQKIPDSNVDVIADAIGLDPRIGNQFLNAGPGFGGSCLPKDLHALIQFSSKLGYRNSFLNAVKTTNSQQAIQVFNLIKLNLGNLKNKKITILGVSFKENSDDIRESVAIKLINLLLRKNSQICAHDPKALENLQKIFGKKITYSTSISKSLKSSDCAIILTAWDEYKTLKNSSFNEMRRKNLIDTRRILSSKKLKLNYVGIGIG